MTANIRRWPRIAVLAVGLMLPALALAGCGQSRDRQLSESLMAAQNAADRAEKASAEAQKAAAQIASGGAANQVVMADEASADDADADEDKASENPDSNFFDNDIVSPHAAPAPQAPPPA